MEASSETFDLSQSGSEGTDDHIFLSEGQSNGTAQPSMPFEIPASQEYFWRADWQDGEREALAELQRGEFLEFDTSNPHGVLDWLHED